MSSWRGVEGEHREPNRPPPTLLIGLGDACCSTTWIDFILRERGQTSLLATVVQKMGCCHRFTARFLRRIQTCEYHAAATMSSFTCRLTCSTVRVFADRLSCSLCMQGTECASAEITGFHVRQRVLAPSPLVISSQSRSR